MSMSFFDDNKNVGLALVIVGLINLIMAVASIIIAVLGDGNVGAAAVGAISFVITGVFLFMYGQKVRAGSNDKVAILSGLIRVIAIITLLGAIFTAISSYMATSSIGVALGAAIVSIIVGLILLWISSKVSGANKNVISNILWILLVLAFLILSVLAFVGFFSNLFLGNFVEAIAQICMLVVYIYAFLACISPEVKTSMGV